MPQNYFCTQAPFGYSSQTLNITEGNLIDQTCQNLEVVDVAIESTNSQAFEKASLDAIPQMFNSLQQSFKNSMKQGFEKILQDIEQAFSKMNKQSSKQDTISKLMVAQKKSDNSA